METIEVKVPAIADVEFELTAEFDDIPVKGNAIASDDDDYDRQIEDEIIDRLESGDVWAWAMVTVTAKYRGFKGYDYLGGCSYMDQSDFENCGYYEDMKDRAYEDLINHITVLAD